SKNDPSDTYDEDNLAECIVDFFIAGTETSATSLQWALLFITNHPDVQGLICYRDRKKLPYTNAVIHEIQRIYYVLSFGIARRCRKDINMLGFYIPKSKNDPSDTYDEDNLAECIVDFFIAGTETSATSLQWALLFITNHPDVQGLICYRDRKKLPYTNAVIHEIQRIYYVLSFGIARRCRKDINMLGFYIPKGSIIVPDLRSVLLDPVQNFQFQLPKGVKQFRQEPISGLTVHPHCYKTCAMPRHNFF
ncbi:putative Cytochrome P450 2J2-like protein, partial [Naja naja]